MDKPLISNINPPSFREAIGYWLRLGFISFGGPAGQIAIMHQDIVENKGWISEQRFLHALNYCMLLPGPEAQQLATYIGWLLHGIKGGVVAGVLFILPSMLIIICLSFIYMLFGTQPLVASMLSAIKPAIVAIILFAAYRMGSRILKNSTLWILALGALLAIVILQWPFPVVIGIAALFGYLGGHYQPALFVVKDSHVTSAVPLPEPIPLPAKQWTKIKNLLKVLLLGLVLWVLPMLALYLVFGLAAIYTQMALFFSKAALLTFGGAYAVLPYVNQTVVEQFGWLTSAQMMDGLALGETTPGPLIMIVTYVGFVAGWSHGLLDAPIASALLAACVATYFTFLPSFIFIFAGAPLIESTTNHRQLNAALTAISSAVVGVILALALFFAHYVFRLGGSIDWMAILASSLAFVLLYRWKISVMQLVLIFMILGLLRFLLQTFI
jgi:chromate transporter